MQPKNKLHYGWAICFCGFMMMGVYMCIVSNGISLFVTPVSTAMGITRQAFSLNTTFFSISGMITSMFIGRIYEKFTIRRTMIFSCTFLPILYGLFSIAPNIYVFYVISFLNGFMFTSTCTVAVSTLMSKWFNEKRGTAMAIASTGSGVSGIILNPIISKLIVSLGYQKTYFILAVFMLVTTLPCALFIVKDSPRDMGIEPYGGAVNKSGANLQKVGMTLKQALKSPSFYLWIPVCVIIKAVSSSTMQHSISYFTDVGYDYVFAAKISSIMTASLAIFKIILGVLFDKIGAKKGLTFALCTYSGVFVLYQFVANKRILYLAAALVGVGLSLSTVAVSLVTQDLFGKKDYANVYGKINVAVELGGALGAPFIAGVFDTFGSYRYAWITYTVLTLVGALLVNLAYRQKEKGIADGTVNW